MTLTAFVTSDKRFRFNVDAKHRTANNFTVDNSYLSSRADHSKYINASEIIKKGPSAQRKSRRGKKNTFPFGITQSMHPANESEPTPAPQAASAAAADSNISAYTGEGEHPEAAFLRKALGGGILCSKCSVGEGGGRKGEIGNPTELSILRAAYFGDVNVTEVKDSSPVIAEVPFSSEYKFMTTVHSPVAENDTEEYMDKLIVHAKGAPDRMIPLCKYQAKSGSFKEEDLEPCDKDYWIEQIAILSSHGLRVLALTRGTLGKDEVSQDQQLGPGFVQERGEP